MIAVEFSEGLENFYNAEIDAILLRTVGAWCSNQPKSYERRSPWYRCSCYIRVSPLKATTVWSGMMYVAAIENCSSPNSLNFNMQ